MAARSTPTGKPGGEPVQLELPRIVEGRNWGGARKGAGRKRVAPRANTPHRPRAPHGKDNPLHVTLRAQPGLPSLREPRVLEMIRSILLGQRSKAYASQFQIVHWSVQHTHVHLIVESREKGHASLRAGMTGFAIAFARRLNKMLNRRGPVWADRFHTTELSSPRQVRNALAYVFHNFVKHGEIVFGGAPDFYSSVLRFDGLERPLDFSVPTGPWARPWPDARPGTWFLRTGWKRHGLIAR